MKTLLIAYYWHPWNNAGTFRWLGFAPYLDFDVLTSKEPVKSYIDETIPDPHKRVKRIGSMWPAKIWGLFAPVTILFKKYDTIIITSSPETLILWAWVFQLMGKRVLLDMRDAIDRDALRGKFMRPIYWFFYKRIKTVTVAFQFIDATKTVVYSGYNELSRQPDALVIPKYYSGRTNYGEYNRRLTMGYLPTFRYKPDGYACSSIHNILHLGYLPDNGRMNPEVYTYKPISWIQGAEIIKDKVKAI